MILFRSIRTAQHSSQQVRPKFEFCPILAVLLTFSTITLILWGVL